MDISTSRAISPLDGRYFQQVTDLSAYFSEFALFKYRFAIEIRYLLFLCNETNILSKLSVLNSDMLTKIVHNFSLEDYKSIKSYEETTKHDVKSLEYFLRDKLGGTSLSGISQYIHLGITSEDTNNLAYVLLLTDFLAKTYLPKLKEIIAKLSGLCFENRDQVIMGRTHGQNAVGTTFGKEMAVYLYRLKTLEKKLVKFKLTGKLNGAVGNYNALNFVFPKVDWLEKSQEFVESLGLVWNPLTTQVEGNDSLVELFDICRHINNILLGLCQDLWRYCSDGMVSLKTTKDEVGSSTMPQKVNPIDFENSEGNLGLANSLLSFLSDKLLISRLQRDLSDSTVKRNIGVAYGHTILAFQGLLLGLNKIEVNKQNCEIMVLSDWSVLAEAVQTQLRAKGFSRGYELIKDLTRGVKISKAEYLKMVEKLDLDKAVKLRLKKLTPQEYIGLAKELVDLAIKA